VTDDDTNTVDITQGATATDTDVFAPGIIGAVDPFNPGAFWDIMA
jgi:hypothetical protein